MLFLHQLTTLKPELISRIEANVKDRERIPI